MSERQFGVCPICGGHFDIEQMEADHIVPWCKGGTHGCGQLPDAVPQMQPREKWEVNFEVGTLS